MAESVGDAWLTDVTGEILAMGEAGSGLRGGIEAFESGGIVEAEDLGSLPDLDDASGLPPDGLARTRDSGSDDAAGSSARRELRERPLKRLRKKNTHAK